jgi:subtilase family serine protease
MRPFRAFLLLIAVSAMFSTLSFGSQNDRLSGQLNAGQVVKLRGNVHGLAKAQFDEGPADPAKLMSGVSLVFKPSASQQADLTKLLAQLQDRSSPTYHRWLTTAQFADRFGMTKNDISKVTAWLQSQGFKVTRTANSRNQIFFQGTVAQIQSAFHTEIHNYRVNGELHFANMTEPSVPAALSGMTIGLGNLHNFQPKARAKVRPNFTSHISGSHFLTPGDFVTIYDLQGLYDAGMDGTGQTIAVTGQSSINTADIDNFRNAAGLGPKDLTQVQVPGTGTPTFCSGDEGESDLDVEWTGGIAKNASITFVYTGLLSGESCSSRSFGAFDSLQYAVDNNIAAFISNSYGNCEANLGNANLAIIQGWAQQANIQGQTIVSASGDSGAADCDFQVTSAVGGFAIDVPAAIPEVTGAGGTEFIGDVSGVVTGNDAGGTTYWSGTTGGIDTLSSALSYIPETSWNDSIADIGAGGTISASGGGTSTFFAKPTWQTGTGVPPDAFRHVPDVAFSSSADHDGYLFCTEDGGGTIIATCGSGFRNSSTDTGLAVVGGTSAAAPTLTATLALINQYLGNLPPGGLGNVNPQLYQFAASAPGDFHDITTGNNVVPCTPGSTDCPSVAPFQFGFTAGTGYDQVTGLGSIKAFDLATTWLASLTPTTTAVVASATTINVGDSITLTATVVPAATASGYVNFYSGTTLLGTAVLDVNGVTNPALTTTAMPAGVDSVTAAYAGSGIYQTSTSVPVTVTVIQPDFSLVAAPNAASVIAGHSVNSVITLTPQNGFSAAVTYTCSAGVTCSFNPSSPTAATAVTVTITTPIDMPTGANTVTITGVSGALSHTTTVSLTVAVTDQSFTLAPTAATITVTAGSPGSTTITMTPTNGFATPLTYSCTDPAPESTCSVSPSTATTSATVTLSITTTRPSAKLRPPSGRESRIFYAALLPGLFGIVFAAGSRKRSVRSMRLLGLIVVLGCSTLWLGACSNNSTTKDPGTGAGNYTITVNATTSTTPPATGSTTVTLQVN